MARKFDQHLAIYKNENLQHSIQNCQRKRQNYVNDLISTRQRHLKFRQSSNIWQVLSHWIQTTTIL